MAYFKNKLWYFLRVCALKITMRIIVIIIISYYYYYYYYYY